MTSFHTLVLSCAAACFAFSVAQAGELHGKTRPPGQAKSCRAYGAGFQQVPGTDVCMKVGGWVRAQSSAHSGGVNWNALNGPGAGATTASAQGYVTTDVRKPTGYGTVRAYVSVGANHE